MEVRHGADDEVPVVVYVRQVPDGWLDAIVRQAPQGWSLSLTHRGPGNVRGRCPKWAEVADARTELLPPNIPFAIPLPAAAADVAQWCAVLHVVEQ